MITAAGTGSGIDVESIITQLMEIESAPQVALEAEREELDVELSAYGSIRSAMNELGTISTTLGDRTTFGPFVATTSDEEVMTATANGTASAEAHDIEILSLATAQRLASGPVASPDADVDAGTYSFTAGEESFSFDLGAGSSLTNLRDAVNDAEDNPGVVASILNVGDGSRLILTARDTGIENAITVNPPGTSLLSGFTEMSAATDAQLIVDGFEVSSASNTVTDVIQGISLELADVGEVSISTARDAESLDESLEALVANYNTLRSGLDGLSIGTLQGDSLPRDIESRLRSLFSEPITLSDGSEASPLELGMTFDRFGALSIDQSRMSEVQDADLERFVDAFSQSETGFAAKLSEVVDAFTDAEGIINGREESIQNRQGRIDDRIDLFDYRLGLVETRYRNQFTAMDTAIALLNSSSSQLFGALST
jgi:flagellar hook-associated protein 2